MRSSAIFVQCLVALVLAACGARHMRESSAPGPVPADKARVVFMRPSIVAGAFTWTILDGQGRFVGEIASGTQFAVDVDPGAHVFICWAENSAALQAEVAAGRTYHVVVTPRPGAMTARAHLLALKPGSEHWPERAEWGGKLSWRSVDRAAGQAELDGRGGDAGDRARRGRATLAEYTPEELGLRTLAPGDGL